MWRHLKNENIFWFRQKVASDSLNYNHLIQLLKEFFFLKIYIRVRNLRINMADGSVLRSLKILETMRDFVLSLSGPKEGFVFVFNK